LLEVEVIEAPQVRYTQDNQTPVAEMAVQIEGLRPDDPPGQLKVVGWGSLAQDLQNRVQVGQRLVLEGRLRMNTVTRQDGVKEKRAELPSKLVRLNFPKKLCHCKLLVFRLMNLLKSKKATHMYSQRD
jgi:single-stranded DNA-binding protein